MNEDIDKWVKRANLPKEEICQLCNSYHGTWLDEAINKIFILCGCLDGIERETFDGECGEFTSKFEDVEWHGTIAFNCPTCGNVEGPFWSIQCPRCGQNVQYGIDPLPLPDSRKNCNGCKNRAGMPGNWFKRWCNSRQIYVLPRDGRECFKPDPDLFQAAIVNTKYTNLLREREGERSRIDLDAVENEESKELFDPAKPCCDKCNDEGIKRNAKRYLEDDIGGGIRLCTTHYMALKKYLDPIAFDMMHPEYLDSSRSSIL